VSVRRRKHISKVTILAGTIAIAVAAQWVYSSSRTSGPSGVAMPTGDLPGWHETFSDNFTKNAPLGSWATKSPGKVVYTGDHGGKWVVYPDGWPCGSRASCYEPSQVLSVHDGVLDFWLHDCKAGLPCSASPSPVLPATRTPYQRYGRYVARFKLVYGDGHKLDDYHIAWLLWPKDGSRWQCAESDFPENDLNTHAVGAFAHYGCAGAVDHYGASLDWTQWHTFVQEWGPGYRSYYLDGKLLGRSTNHVYHSPERWELQIDTQTDTSHPPDSGSGHLLVDWVVVYARKGA
jgi:hypothetical protein